MKNYDLAVIGAGPAGHFGAIQAAKLGKRVVVVESERRLGGNSANLGTIPSKSLREATLHLTGHRQRNHYGEGYRVKEVETLSDLTVSSHQIVSNQTQVFKDQLRRNKVELRQGQGAFVGPNQIVVERPGAVEVFNADKVLLAVGSSPARPPGLDFDGERILDSNQILALEEIPRRLIIVGAGVIGVEYACIFAAIGVHVTLINNRETFLDFVDRQLVEVLKFHMANQGVEFRMGEEVTGLSRRGRFVQVRTASNKEIVGDACLYCAGRQGNTEFLNLEAAGLAADARGRLGVNEDFQTELPHVYAAGDVVGFPALAATSREQGRRAVCHAFGLPYDPPAGGILPYGIYAIPEISMFGPTEQELTAKRVHYEVGIARYKEIARGQIVGDTSGMMKLLFDPESLKLLGVHIIGDGATELVHIGQAVYSFGGTLHYLANNVFNYPTLAECYKVAALDGINRARLSLQSRGQPLKESDLVDLV